VREAHAQEAQPEYDVHGRGGWRRPSYRRKLLWITT
jgi:hypothetical protein